MNHLQKHRAEIIMHVYHHYPKGSKFNLKDKLKTMILAVAFFIMLALLGIQLLELVDVDHMGKIIDILSRD